MQILHGADGHPLRLADPLAQHHDLLLDGRILGQALPQGRFDALEDFHVVLGDAGDGVAGLPRARGAAHAVDVRVAVGGEVEVHDGVDGGDVEAAGGDVGGDEDGAGAGAEFAERAEAGGLRELAVEGDGAEAEGAQEDGEALGFVDGAGEDDGGLAGVVVEEGDEVEVFVFVREEEVGLEEGGHGLVFVCGDGDAEGVGEGSALE